MNASEKGEVESDTKKINRVMMSLSVVQVSLEVNIEIEMRTSK